jgi:hypothetical protein
MQEANFASLTEKREFAFELKFLLPDALAPQILDWAQKHLSPDPNANGDGGGGYGVNSLYFDTSGLHVYHRKGSYGRCKYRIRRYAREATLFLERKLKTGGRVAKRRTRVLDGEIANLKSPRVTPQWPGFWFRRRIDARQLLPQCQIAYDRIASVGLSPEGPLRLTLDQNIRSIPNSTVNFVQDAAWRPILPGRCVMEMKYRVNLPALFKGLITDFSLKPQPVSKYRLTVEAFGWVPPAEAASPSLARDGDGHPAENSAAPHAPVTGWTLSESVRSV